MVGIVRFCMMAVLVLFGVAYAETDEARLLEIAASKEWLILGGWDKTTIPGRGWRSDVISEDFFLAENGRREPLEELRATLQGLALPLPDDPGERVLCQYPGRAVFLRQQGLAIADPVALCPEIAEFLEGGATDNVSVLFISGYLSNPGSAFGHLLLRFHADGDDEPVEDVLDRAINYGAASSEEDPLLTYLVKGLFGGYHSTYTTVQFYHQAERYRELELRTIWQYKLDLTAEETLLLTTHIYELLRTENRYYFLRQNCAWRIAETLELVVDRDLLPNTKVWVTPIDIFHQLTGDAPDGGPAVADVKRLASRETLFLEGYAALDVSEKRFVDEAIDQPSRPIRILLDETPIEQEAAALDVLLDYYAYVDETPEDIARQRDVTIERFKRPPSPPPTEKRRIPPHTGQRPSLLQMTALSNDELGEGAEIRIRPAYFDLLSSTVGTVPYSEVVMADARVLIRDGDVHLRSLEAVRVTNLSPQTKNAPGSGDLAWRVRFGAEDRDLGCDDCLLGYGEFGAGKAYEVAKDAALYGLVAGRAEAGPRAESTFHVRPSAGLVINRTRTALQIEGGVLQGLDESDETRLFGKAELRLGQGQRWDIRASTAYDEALETSLSVGFYW